MLLGVDVGGTFTDAVLYDGHGLHTAKAPTTPDDQSRGVIAAIELVLERSGADAADVGAAHRRGHPGPGAEPPRGVKAADVADLGDNEHRDVAADAADLQSTSTKGSSLARASISRLVRSISREVGDQRERAVESSARRFAQLKLGEEAQAASPEHVAVGGAIPFLARIAATRFLSAERILVSATRWRNRSRRSRSSRGAM